MKTSVRDKVIGAIFILPALILFSLFVVYPIINSFVMAFFTWNGFNPTKTFVGFANLLRVMRDRIFWQGVGNAAILAIAAMLVMNPLALFFATLVGTNVKGRNIYRVVFYLPVMLSGIVVGFVWRWMFNGDAGLVNHVLNSIGLSSLARDWLNTGPTAMFAIVVASVWQGIGSSFILYMAALTNVPTELYESASLDGASFFQKLRYITLPSIRKMMTIIVILTMVGAVNTYQIVLSLTNSGPAGATTVPMVYILDTIQLWYDYGYGTAMAVVLGLILLALSLIRLYFDKRKEDA